MNFRIPPRLLTWPALSGIGIACCVLVYFFYIPSYTPAVMKTFSSQTRTHCVGRYLIDLPTDLGEPAVSYAVLYFGLGPGFKRVEIETPKTGDIDWPTFERLVAARRAELISTKDAESGVAMLLKEEAVSTPDGRAVMFRRLYSDRGPTTLVSELHAFVQGRYVSFKTESYPPATPIRQSGEAEYKLVDPEPAEARLRLVAQHIHAVPEPSHAPYGFCINNVLFSSPDIGHDEEKATFHFVTNHGALPSLSLEVSMNGKFGYSDPDLHTRMRERSLAIAMYPTEGLARTHRKTERKLAGMPFQEWVDEMYMRHSKGTQYSLQVENQRTDAEGSETFMRPAMSIKIESGSTSSSEDQSPYSLSQIEKAWDQWLPTLRLSPGNGGVPR